MSWQDFITPARISTGVEVANQREAIQMLAQLIAGDLNVEAAPLQAALEAREKLGSTAIGKGVALPHAKAPALLEPAGAMLILKKPLSCTSPDDVPVDIFIGFLVPTEGGDFGFLSQLARHLREDTLLRELRLAETPAQAHMKLMSRSSP